MAEKPQRVYVEREDEEGKTKGWRLANLEFDEMAGTINLRSVGALGKKWEMTFTPSAIGTFAIDLVKDVNTLAAFYGGGLVGYGMAALMSRWVKTPVVRLEQPMAEPGQRQARLRVPGMRPKKTRELAERVERTLRERGYNGIMPNLADEDLWKVNTGAILLGCGGVIAAVVVCLLIIMVLSAMSS